MLAATRHRCSAHGLYHLGIVLHHQGKIDEAADTFRQAAALYRRLPHGADAGVGREPVDAGGASRAADGRRSAVASLYAEALDGDRRLYGVDHPEYAEVLRDSANAIASRDSSGLARAEAQMSQAVRIYARLRGAGS